MMGNDATGNLLRQYRKEKGLTQKQLGERCGMADSAIRKYESGKVVPKWDTVKRLAAALEIDPFLLIEKNDLEYLNKMFVNEIKERTDEALELVFPENPNIIKKLVDSLEKLNPTGQQIAVKRVKELAEIREYQKNPYIPGFDIKGK